MIYEVTLLLALALVLFIVIFFLFCCVFSRLFL